MNVKNYEEKLAIPENIKVEVGKGIVTVNGKKGTLRRDLYAPQINITKEDSSLVFRIKKFSKKEKTLLGSYKAHIKNMIRGVQEGFVYRLKICSGHFPMNVSFRNHEIVIKNFIGEKVPRVLKVDENVDVKIEGDVITLEAIDIELGGQTAGLIEKLTSRPGYDKRVFQQGIYIFEKPN